MSKRVLLLFTASLAAVALVAASCSSGDEAASTTSSSATTASVTTTTEAPTTSEEPTTTVDPVAEAEEAAAQAVLEKAEAWLECVADVPTCDPISTLSGSTGGASLAELTSTLESWQRNGWETRPPLDPTHGRTDVVEVDVATGGDSATVTSCTIDGVIVVDPGAAPDGSDVIVNDQVSSFLAESSVLLGDDGQWRVHEVELLGKFEGGDGCGDTSA